LKRKKKTTRKTTKKNKYDYSAAVAVELIDLLEMLIYAKWQRGFGDEERGGRKEKPLFNSNKIPLGFAIGLYPYFF